MRSNKTGDGVLMQFDRQEIVEVLRAEIQAALTTQTTQLNRYHVENITEAIRRESKLTFWQGVSVALFMFILSLFVAILFLILQK
ncbi:MAG TPA: hypothetical protein VEZ40_16900 [Pyrinomonadaceae bacterium]|nr:hypothetical protein [Pyrinomonadaceae bacterium]